MTPLIFTIRVQTQNEVQSYNSGSFVTVCRHDENPSYPEREVRAAKIEATNRKQTRDAAEKRLRRKMHCVVLLLSIPLGKSDPRWLAFGLNQPKPGAPKPVRRFAISAEVVTLPNAPTHLMDVA